jgi:hypothetical protein
MSHPPSLALLHFWPVLLLGVLGLFAVAAQDASAAQLRAGAAKVDITHPDHPPKNERLYARALVIDDGTTTAVLVAVDAVAIGEIGYIGNDYLPAVRSALQRELKLKPEHVLVNASHCHGIVAPDAAQRTIQAVREAHGRMVPVRAGTGAGSEDRISENRRLRLKNGKEADVRHAYSLPPDTEIAGVGPIDPQIGVLRLDAESGKTVAVVYNFACHPIQGVPGGTNTADLTGFSSRVIEENLSEGAVALFVQGCAGDVNPVYYKDVDHPRDAETLGNLLGLSTLRAVRRIRTSSTGPLTLTNRSLALPRADLAGPIAALEAEEKRLVGSFTGTSLNLKTFLALAVKHGLSPEYPSGYSFRYLHDRQVGRPDLPALDAENRKNMQAYLRNVLAMESLTRVKTNLALLRRHQERNRAAGKSTVDVEVCGLRVGDFRLITFPGELTVEIGLGIKKRAGRPHTYVAGYTNGYLFYTPTEEQLRNVGWAQEDSDCYLGSGWQKLFEEKVEEILRTL